MIKLRTPIREKKIDIIMMIRNAPLNIVKIRIEKKIKRKTRQSERIFRKQKMRTREAIERKR